MENNIMTVNFLNKTYSLPADVITYVDFVDFTNGIRDTLMSTFKIKTHHSIDTIESDSFMLSDLSDQASLLVRRLLSNDIYDRTTTDYLHNKGYDLFLETKRKAVQQIISIRKEKLDTYRSGVESAIYRKESSVTGLDFGIISGSFVNHMIYAYMDASEQTKQEKEALKTYNREIAELKEHVAQYDQQERTYISEHLIPAMHTVFTFFAYEMLDKYISDLIAVGKFDATALNYINLERSNDLLKNLDYASNKKAVIESAFSACPFNIAVYMQAMKHDLLDYDSFQIAKLFNHDKTIVSFLKKNLGEVSFPVKFNINYHCAELLALLTDKTLETFLRVHTEQYATGIVKAYARVAEMIEDKNRCRKVIGECKENAILEDDSICRHKARSYVNPIAPDPIWSQLTEQCGQKDLLKRIKKFIPQNITIDSKEDADKYFTEQLCAAFEAARKELVDEILRMRQEEEERRKEDLRRKQEVERICEEKRQKQIETKRKAFKVLLKVAVGLLSVVVVYFVISLFINKVVKPTNQYNEAVALLEAGDYQAAREIFVSLGRYKDCEVLIEQCDDIELETIYTTALELMSNKKYEDAISLFALLRGYKSTNEKMELCYEEVRSNVYDEIIMLIKKGNYNSAYDKLVGLGDYQDCKLLLKNFKLVYTKETYDFATSDSNDRSYDYLYDQNGNLIRKTESHEHGKFVIENKYDNNGHLIEEKGILSSGETMSAIHSYDGNGNIIQSETKGYHGKNSHEYYVYNDQGDLLEHVTDSEENRKVSRYEYNSMRQLISFEVIDDKTVRYEYIYNEKGELIKETNGQYETTYEYDKKGNLIREEIKAGDERTIINYVYNKDAHVIKETEITYRKITTDQYVALRKDVTSYTYNLLGQLIEKDFHTYIDDKDKGSKERTIYKYNPNSTLAQIIEYKNGEIYLTKTYKDYIALYQNNYSIDSVS